MSAENSTALLIGPISPSAPGPLYQQIIDGVRRAVSEGRLEPGIALPSFRVLAAELMVSLITVKRAYEDLEREGIIFRRQGLGTFVADQGDAASREAKIRTARTHFEKGAREAAEAGLSGPEIEDLALQSIRIPNKNEIRSLSSYRSSDPDPRPAQTLSRLRPWPDRPRCPARLDFGFVGPNGAGKSTTIDLMFGMGRVDAGSIRMLGLEAAADEVTVEPRRLRGTGIGIRQLGKNPQSHPLRPRILSGDLGRCLLPELLDRFNLNPDDKIATLSFGSRTKLGARHRAVAAAGTAGTRRADHRIGRHRQARAFRRAAGTGGGRENTPSSFRPTIYPIWSASPITSPSSTMARSCTPGRWTRSSSLSASWISRCRRTTRSPTKKASPWSRPRHPGPRPVRSQAA